MAVTTSQQISRYYNQFQNAEVTFTKEVIKATMLYPKQVYLKCLGYQWPCILYSSSMSGAKVLASVRSSLKDALQQSKNVVSLRFSFLQQDKADPLTFFVAARVVGQTPYGSANPELSFVQLQFTQRPPDDLIEILGSLLEAGINAQRRREERIIMNPDSVKKLGLVPKGTQLLVANVPRKCILRDLSFSGAKVIIHGVAQFLLNKPALLHVEFDDPSETIEIVGKIIRFEPVQGRTDIAAFALLFHEGNTPIAYKMRINAYLRQFKPPKTPLGADTER